MFCASFLRWFCLYDTKHQTEWVFSFFKIGKLTSIQLYNSSIINTTHLFLSVSDLNDTFSEGNSDTVGQIVHYIMKNEGKLNECVDKDEFIHYILITLKIHMSSLKEDPGCKASELMTCLWVFFIY